MKRSEKIALLTKIIQGDAPAIRLQQATLLPRRGLVIETELSFANGQPMNDSDPVTFHDRGKQYRMSWAEANQYADRHRIGTFIILPAKQIA